MPLLNLVNERPIALYPIYCRIAGSLSAGVMLSQLVYWQHIVDAGKGGVNGWIYKTIKEMEKETYLSRHEQMTARKQLKKLNIIEEKKEGLPCKLFYRVNGGKLEKLLLLQCNRGSVPKPKNKKAKKNDEEKYIEAAVQAANPADPTAYAATVRHRLAKQGGLYEADQLQLAAWEQAAKPIPQIISGDVIDYGDVQLKVKEIHGSCIATISGEIIPIGPIITSLLEGKAKLIKKR